MHPKKRRKRQITKDLVWLMLPVIIIAGLIYPILGIFILLCMLTGISIAVFKGRFWCGWICPRGSFLDNILGKLNKKRRTSTYNSRLKMASFRISFLIFIMIIMAIQVYRGWPNFESIGSSMVRILTVTTVIAILIGLVIHPRAWCSFCPIGTMSSWLSSGKEPLKIDPKKCVDCGNCYKSCPVSIDPRNYKEQTLITDKDCIKCEVCLENCPKDAISTI